ncbi:hypothetical protein M422DRAFT_239662 [Sphaerobolus stellatus SS14]|nr:hypothetical protein M422DRAFT_239662 [Sphaerobolus stellatus SS14]
MSSPLAQLLLMGNMSQPATEIPSKFAALLQENAAAKALKTWEETPLIIKRTIFLKIVDLVTETGLSAGVLNNISINTEDDPSLVPKIIANPDI